MKIGNERGVVLQNVVREFEHVANNIASHSNVHNTNIYPQPCTYLTTHYVCMKAAGYVDIDYDVLAVVSGSSALFGYEPNEFMPKYANLHIDIAERIARATGFGWERPSADSPAECYDIIRESIEDSKPVKAVCAEYILFTGFDDSKGKGVYVLSDGADYWNSWVSWEMFSEWYEDWSHIRLGRYSGEEAQCSDEEVAVEVLKNLCNWARTPPDVVQNEYPNATFGLEGIERYASDCKNMEKYPDWRACHDINPQWVTRNSTAVYLEKICQEKTFDYGITEQLLKASNLYRRAYESWKEFYGVLGDDAPGDAGKNKRNRVSAADFVLEALEHEKSALGFIAKALSTMEDGEAR